MGPLLGRMVPRRGGRYHRGMSAEHPEGVVIWNGHDLPEELRALPPGVYELRPHAGQPAQLSAEEEASVLSGLKDKAEGNVLSREEADALFRKAIARGAGRARGKDGA